jgi:hypothetical protein
VSTNFPKDFDTSPDNNATGAMRELSGKWNSLTDDEKAVRRKTCLLLPYDFVSNAPFLFVLGMV